MYRKVFFIFSAAASSVAVGYGVKNQYFKESHAESEVINERTFVSQEEKEHLENVHLSTQPSSSQAAVPSTQDKQSTSYSEAITKARDLAYRLKDEIGSPGLVIGVSVNGKTIWAEGLGMANVENRVPCHADTVMRIASISKSITMAVVARMWQEGKLDLDKPVQEYVPTFPIKKFNNKEVTITTRQLVSHLAGIRHYIDKNKKASAETPAPSSHDTSFDEFYLKDRFATVVDSLKLFQNDALKFEPGTSFLYTTHGWTLVSAVVEAVGKRPFTDIIKEFFAVMGLKHTYLDEPEPLIYNRAQYYKKNGRGRLENVPYVDNSYKWAGGGFLSTVGDLLQFGNAMLYSYQWHSDLLTKDGQPLPPGYLSNDTVNCLWSKKSDKTMKWGRADGYGMGWVVVPHRQEHGGGDMQKFTVGHTGGAIGASSVLLMVPASDEGTDIPRGVTVAVMVNLQDIGLQRLAQDVAALFCEAS